MKRPDDPVDPDHPLVETTVSSQAVFEGGFLKVWRDRARLSNGSLVQREFIRHPGAVMVVPKLDDDRFVMVRQFRYPLRQILLEFPAGKIDPGEQPLDTGVRELLEETGYVAREWALAGRLHNAAAYSDEFIEIWFARHLTAGPSALDADELLEVCEVKLDTLRQAAARGELTDAKTQIGLLWLEHVLAGRWQPRWQSLEAWRLQLAQGRLDPADAARTVTTPPPKR